MSRTRPRTAFFRSCMSGLLAALVTVVVLVLVRVADADTDATRLLVISYVVAWPLYTALYVGWSTHAYSRLDAATLQRVAVADDRGEQRLLPRVLGVTGATNTTVSAAVVAVIVTIAIAQTPEFRSEVIYLVLALVTVASSWVLMVFSFAQSYLRLGAGDEHIRFRFADPAQFGDYVTLAVMVSTMAATDAAEVASRKAWRVVRTNVVIAFVFNSVIIAMMVSLLFG